jgi:hypothetical protein
LLNFISDWYYESKQSYYDLFLAAGISWKKTTSVNPKADEDAVAAKKKQIETLDLLQKCLNCHGSRSETSLRFLATLRFAQNDIHDFLTFARSLFPK